MPLPFDYEQEFQRVANEATMHDSTHTDVFIIGAKALGITVEEARALNIPSVFFEIQWNTVVAQSFYEMLQENNEKCPPGQHPKNRVFLTGAYKDVKYLDIEYTTENGELVLSCFVQTSSETPEHRKFRLSDAVKTA